MRPDEEATAKVVAALCFALATVTPEHDRARAVARARNDEDWTRYLPMGLGPDTASNLETWLRGTP